MEFHKSSSTSCRYVDQLWNDSEVQTYHSLGPGDKLGIYFRTGGHAQNEDDWRTLVDFADKVFFGKTPASGKRFDKLPFPDAPRPFSWSVPKGN